MAGLATPPAQDNMVDLFARRLKLPTRATCMTDVLSPSQVRTFSDCEVRWFYEHLLGLPDPPTATMALHNAIRTALMTNFRYKVESKADIQTEGVVGLFRRAWKRQQASVIFCDDEVPEAMGRTGEARPCLHAAGGSKHPAGRGGATLARRHWGCSHSCATRCDGRGRNHHRHPDNSNGAGPG